MKKRLAKILSMALVFVMVMCLVPPVEAAASTKKPFFPEIMEFNYFKKSKDLNTEHWVFGDEGVNYKITNVKSSDKKVMVASKVFDGEYSMIKMKAKKPGKTTITFKAKIGNKTYNYKVKVKVVNYTNPLKSFKIGKTDYASKFSHTFYHRRSGKKKIAGKLAIKPNPDWKVAALYTYDFKTGKEKNVKNNKKITLKKNQSLVIHCINKKTGQGITLNFSNES